MIFLRRGALRQSNPMGTKPNLPPSFHPAKGAKTQWNFEMNINLNRAQRSKLHVAMLAALDVPNDEPDTAANAAKQAFTEAVCWADTGGIEDLATLFALADAINFEVVKAVHNSESQYTEVNADALREVHGAPTVNLSLKLVGHFPRQRGRKMIWSDAPNADHTLATVVHLESNILETWGRD